MRKGTCLDLDLTLPAHFVAVRTFSPPLNEVARSGSSGQLEVSGGGDFSGGQLGSGLECRRSPPEHVCFPLRGTERCQFRERCMGRESRGVHVPPDPLLACIRLLSATFPISKRDGTAREVCVTCAGDLLVVQLVKLTDMGIMAVRVCEPPLAVL